MKNEFCSIYVIKNKINNKVYVGQTWESLDSRLSKHKNDKKSCSKLFNALNKYGRDNFYIRCLTTCEDQKIANVVEIFWIKTFDSIKNGYNILLGGKNSKMPDEVKIKLSIAHTGKKLSEETKEKIREANIGKILTDETKEKLSIANSGENSHWFGKFGNEHPRFGIPQSDETKKLISELVSGENNPMFGKFGSDHPRFGKPGLKGEDSPNSKLTQELVDKIREDYKIIKSSRKLGKLYNVNQKTILNIINNKSWVKKETI